MGLNECQCCLSFPSCLNIEANGPTKVTGNREVCEAGKGHNGGCQQRTAEIEARKLFCDKGRKKTGYKEQRVRGVENREREVCRGNTAYHFIRAIRGNNK